MPDDTQMALRPKRGSDPRAVRDDLLFLGTIQRDDIFELSIVGGPRLASGTGLEGASMADIILPVALNLAELQDSSVSTFAMPDITEVTISQAEQLAALTDFYRGNALTTNWSRLVLTVGENSESLLALWIEESIWA